MAYLPLCCGLRRALSSLSSWFCVEFCLTTCQLRVTAARPGTVNFELEIQKEHTVRLFPALAFLPLPDLPR